MSPLVLAHCGVSPMPFLPQESTYISYANVVHCSSLGLNVLVMSKAPMANVMLQGHKEFLNLTGKYGFTRSLAY